MKSWNSCIVILLSLLCLSCYIDLTAQNVYGESNLKGQVKTIEESTYSVNETNGEFKKSTLISKIVRVYDKAGKKVGLKVYNKEGDLKEVIACLYNEAGNLKTETGIDAQGEFTTRTTYEYNSSGLMIEEKLWSPIFANPIATTTYTYDSLGRMKESFAWYSKNKNEVMWKYVYDYNEKGQKVEEKLYKNGESIEHIYTYEYNDQGYLSKEEQTGVKFGSTSTFKYNYDEKGNWIKRVEMFSGKPSEIIERNIVYYD